MDLAVIGLVAVLTASVGYAISAMFAKARLKSREELFAQEKSQFEQQIAALEERCQGLDEDLTFHKTEFHKSIDQISQLKDELVQQKTAFVEEIATLRANNESLEKSKSESVDLFKTKNSELTSKLDSVNEEKNQLSQKVAAFEESREQRSREFEEKINQLNRAFEQREKEREREMAASEEEEKARLKLLKETWARHESNIEEKMRLICQRQGIEFINKEKFPHKGKPDNAVKICDEFIVFDSKSPDGDNLDNFRTYIKREAEAAKKYTKFEDVKNDVYLVVPTSAIEVLDETYISQGDFRVHVITEDALEPILIALKKVEEYEFAEKLSPDDREKIVSVIGKMAHGMKRRIQVDYFFANEFISVLTDAENLPDGILQEAQKVERSSKLNPPLERRAKAIDSKSLTKEADKLVGKAASQDINLQTSFDIIKQVPLHSSKA